MTLVVAIALAAAFHAQAKDKLPPKTGETRPSATPETPPKQAAPATAEEAVRRLQQLWRDSLAIKFKDSVHFKRLAEQINETDRVKASLVKSAEAWGRIASLGQFEQTLILFGKADDLKRDKPVWDVIHGGSHGSDVQAYLDSATGELLLLRIIPEG